MRLDRIGDLVLTLPTDSSLSLLSVDWWIPKGLSFVTEHAQPVRSAREFPRSIGFFEALRLAREVRKKSYDLAVIFHAPWWVSFVLWLARVPVRIGVRSQWHSFLFLNRGVRQKRSRAECSELEYNYRLIEDGLALRRGTLLRQTLRLRAKSGRPGLAPSVEYYVVHPGMSGSALNWPIEKWGEFINRLDRQVVITGTHTDASILNDLQPLVLDKALWLNSKLSGSDLIDLLAHARAVIAPSTGVLHLAASTGVPTLGVFSNVLVQRAVRWGPQGDRVAVVEAPSDCPSDDCMSRISVDEVLAKLAEIVR